MQKQLL